MTYSSGRTYQDDAGAWWTEWSEDADSGAASGPFACEADAAGVFLA